MNRLVAVTVLLLLGTRDIRAQAGATSKPILIPSHCNETFTKLIKVQRGGSALTGDLSHGHPQLAEQSFAACVQEVPNHAPAQQPERNALCFSSGATDWIQRDCSHCLAQAHSHDLAQVCDAPPLVASSYRRAGHPRHWLWLRPVQRARLVALRTARYVCAT